MPNASNTTARFSNVAARRGSCRIALFRRSSASVSLFRPMRRCAIAFCSAGDGPSICLTSGTREPTAVETVSAIAATGKRHVRARSAAVQERATRTERPQRSHVQRSYSLPGQPADSLWKISTSGTAKTVSIAQRSCDFWRTSTRQSLTLQRRQGGRFAGGIRDSSAGVDSGTQASAPARLAGGACGRWRPRCGARCRKKTVPALHGRGARGLPAACFLLLSGN